MRILLYVCHQQTLGEVQRAVSLTQFLSDRHDVLVVNAGARMPLLDNAVALPFPLYDANTLRYGTGLSRTPDQIAARIRVLTKASETFKPDLILVMGFPFHFAEEFTTLMPFLTSVKRTAVNVPVVCSIGYPLSTTSSAMQERALERFNHILVHCPEELDPQWIDAQQNQQLTILLQAWKKQGACTFTNYILPQESRQESQIVHKSSVQKMLGETIGERLGEYVLVSRGSGTVCDMIIAHARTAAQLLKKKAIIVNGLFGETRVSSENDAVQDNAVQDHVLQNHEVVHLSQADFASYVRGASCSVSMAGYGTAVQLLFARQNHAVLIPKPARIDTEQDYRARMLEHLLGAIVLSYDVLSPQRLSAAMQNAMSVNKSSRMRINDAWFSGLDVTRAVLQEVFQIATERK